MKDLFELIEEMPDDALARVAPHVNLIISQRAFFDGEAVRDVLRIVAMETRHFRRIQERAERAAHADKVG